jgi:RNA polymerase sigma factor (sigma-70 family)
MVDDGELLRRYAEEGSEESFREVVQRHYDLVHSAALRQVAGDPHLAQDVAQVVFTVLARKAEKVSRRPVLVGWLYVTTRMAAAQAVRNERRWKARSLNVDTMDDSQGNASTSMNWERVRLLLDTAMCELRDADREAILVRFFKGRPFAELGEELGVSADAARMRVDRAVERLRIRLARHGVTSSAAALAEALAGHSVAAAPAGLASAAAGGAISGAASGGALGIASFMSITKLQASLAGTLLAAGLATGVLITQKNREVTAEINHLAKTTLSLNSAERENKRLQGLHSALAGLVEQEKIAAASLQAELAAAHTDAARITKPLSGWSAPSTVLASAPVLEPRSLDVQPVPIDQVLPKYPPAYQKSGQSGEVLVDFVVGTDGSVINASAISSSDKAFEPSAVEAVSQWLYQPGQKDGNVVNTHMQVPIVYTR